eukprot:m.163517 g.163517  ORF g.163517 m.163517 type:complete len:268 (-) comp14390_c0_seq1:332-1135(-)
MQVYVASLSSLLLMHHTLTTERLSFLVVFFPLFCCVLIVCEVHVVALKASFTVHSTLRDISTNYLRSSSPNRSHHCIHKLLIMAFSKREEMRMCGLIHCAFEKNQKLCNMVDRPLAKTLHQRHIWHTLQFIFTQTNNPEMLAKLPVSARRIRDAYILAEMNLAHESKLKHSSLRQSECPQNNPSVQVVPVALNDEQYPTDSDADSGHDGQPRQCKLPRRSSCPTSTRPCLIQLHPTRQFSPRESQTAAAQCTATSTSTTEKKKGKRS